MASSARFCCSCSALAKPGYTAASSLILWTFRSQALFSPSTVFLHPAANRPALRATATSPRMGPPLIGCIVHVIIEIREPIGRAAATTGPDGARGPAGGGHGLGWPRPRDAVPPLFALCRGGGAAAVG